MAVGLAGLDVALAVDVDKILTSSYRTNFPSTRLARWNLTTTEPSRFKKFLKPGARLAGIVGGPPCQAFSEIGRRSKTDTRRDLVWDFFRIVAALRPSFFVMENVPGLGHAGNK